VLGDDQFDEQELRRRYGCRTDTAQNADGVLIGPIMYDVLEQIDITALQLARNLMW
jgi:hypothetical protein